MLDRRTQSLVDDYLAKGGQITRVERGVSGLRDLNYREWKARVNRINGKNVLMKALKKRERAARGRPCAEPIEAPKPSRKPPAKRQAKQGQGAGGGRRDVARDRRICQLAAKGHSYAEIAKEIGINRRKLYRVMQRLGVKAKRDIVTPYGRMSDDARARVLTMWRAGASIAETAEAVGFAAGTISHVRGEFRKAGLAPCFDDGRK